MSSQWHDTPVEDFVGFLDDVSREQEVLDLADEYGPPRSQGVLARVLRTLPTLVPLVVLLWVAGRFDLWLSPVWLAATALWWVGSVWFARRVWTPAAPAPAAEPAMAGR